MNSEPDDETSSDDDDQQDVDASAGRRVDDLRSPEPGDTVDPLAAPTTSTVVRLQKVLAAAGVGSRRTCEQLIVAGRVRVDGALADQLGARVDPNVAVVTVDGRRVSVRPDLVHLALNKPIGVVELDVG